MTKKISTTAFCLLLAISVFAYSGGNGTENNPYLISSKADMEELASNVNGGQRYSEIYFLLTQDLTGASDTLTTVVGNNSSYFSGTFDGDGHKIAVNISTTASYAGVFGRLIGATIKNLGVTGSIKSSSDAASYAGGICGRSDNGTTISNCYNTGEISSSSSSSSAAYAGGICGIGNGTISDCYNTGKISASSASSAYVGGICGRSDNGAKINKCYNTGEISASARTRV
jgi:hypothetical protein